MTTIDNRVVLWREMAEVKKNARHANPATCDIIELWHSELNLVSHCVAVIFVAPAPARDTDVLGVWLRSQFQLDEGRHLSLLARPAN